jgi:hypothetical protein
MPSSYVNEIFYRHGSNFQHYYPMIFESTSLDFATRNYFCARSPGPFSEIRFSFFELLATTPTATPTAGGLTGIRRNFVFCDLDQLKGDVLKSKLLAHPADKVGRFFLRLVDTAQLDCHRLVGQLRETFRHLTIQNEREIGVKFFLKLKQMGLFAAPESGFVHGQDQSVGAGVVSESVKYSRIF